MTAKAAPRNMFFRAATNQLLSGKRLFGTLAHMEDRQSALGIRKTKAQGENKLDCQANACLAPEFSLLEPRGPGGKIC